MAVVAPFRAVRYNPAKIARMEEVVTPPYDVIDPESHSAFAAKNPYNMINLDLSKSTSPDQMADSRYEQARDIFMRWQEEGVLLRDEQPAIYLYNTEYSLPSGKRLVRKGLLCLVRLAEFSEGIVKPHEKTFSGVTSDRLRLLDTCHAQFSPIFSLYSDATGRILSLLEGAAPIEPLAVASDHDGCVHSIRAVYDPAALAEVGRLFADKPLYIADGHHRYTTALQFRAMMRERMGEVPVDSPYNHTMMYLCGMEDPGLSVLPTHRLVRLPEAESFAGLAEKFAQSFAVEEIRGGTREALVLEVMARMADGASGGTRFGLYHPREDRCLLLSLRPEGLEAMGKTGHPEALRDLDVVILSDLILAGLLGLDHDRCEKEGLVEYYSDPDTALDVAVKRAESDSAGSPLLFLMNPTLVSQVKRVADEGLVMPHKSTYFYPKLLTGLLLNKIVSAEKIPG